MEADLIVSCPYNPSHRIRKYKFMSHITKCKKTSNVQNMVECPLNSTHIVDREHLKEHIKTCPSIGKLADTNSEIYDNLEADTESPVFVNTYSSENWEEEPKALPYNPMEASAKKPVIRCVFGLTKSEKKKFKESERLRMAKLREFPFTNEPLPPAKDMIDEIPLRPPRAISSTKNLRDDLDETTEEPTYDDPNADTQVKSIPEFNNTFYKMLYDELAPENDNVVQLEQPQCNINTKTTLKHYFQHVTGEKNPAVSDKEKEKNEASSKKVQPMEETIMINQINENSDEKEVALDELLSKFNERLTYLTKIQNAAAEESARILEQLKELKLRKTITANK